MVKDVKETEEKAEASTPVVEAVEAVVEEAPAKEPAQEEPSTSQISIDLEPEGSSGSKMKIIAVVLLVILLIGGVVGGYLLFRGGKSEEKSKGEPEKKEQVKEEKSKESSEEADVTEADKEKEVNLGDYTVQILNGSGIAGEAGAVVDLLKEEGFEDFDTDNAESYDYTDTQASLKKAVPDKAFEAIKGALSDYTVIKSDSLTEDAAYDIIVIVGTKTE